MCLFWDNDWNCMYTGPDECKQALIKSKCLPFSSCFSESNLRMCVCALMSPWTEACVQSETDREGEIVKGWEEKERERRRTFSSLPWTQWLSHCRWRAFFMLHCCTVLFTALFFMTLLPKDVGVLRRPLTVINITGCLLPTDIWVLLLHHYTSAPFQSRLWWQPQRTTCYTTCRRITEYSNLHLALSVSGFTLLSLRYFFCHSQLSSDLLSHM